MNFIFRAGVPIAIPDAYAADPAHRLLVEQLTGARRYVDAVAILEANPHSFLAADILSGAPWARRYLNTTARNWTTDRRAAARGVRALMRVLAGVKPKKGRARREPLTPYALARAAAAHERWADVVEACWSQPKPTQAPLLLQRAQGYFRVSEAHRRALRALLRRPQLRKRDVILTLTSWETDLPIRQLRLAQPALEDLVYG